MKNLYTCNIRSWIRRLFSGLRDVGPRYFESKSKRELEAALRDAGFSWSEAKIAVSVFTDWTRSGSLRDVEATPNTQRIVTMPVAGSAAKSKPHKRRTQR